MKSKKGQPSYEFLLLLTFVFFLFIIVSAVILQEMGDSVKSQTAAGAQNVLGLVSNEVILAASATDGYSRLFELPLTITGRPYTFEVIKDGPSGAALFSRVYFNDEVIGSNPQNPFGEGIPQRNETSFDVFMIEGGNTVTLLSDPSAYNGPFVMQRDAGQIFLYTCSGCQGEPTCSPFLLDVGITSCT